MATTLEVVGPRVYFRGSEYRGKEVLRNAGARWDPDEKCWWVGIQRQDEAAGLAAESDAAAALSTPRPTRPKKCKDCGATPGYMGWPRIYKNGQCSDCWAYYNEDEPKEW